MTVDVDPSGQTGRRTLRPGVLPRRHGVVVAVTAVVALVAGTLTGCGSGTPERSADNFCSTLREGNDKMRATYEGAGSDAAGQLGAAFANMGAFTTLLHRLDTVAPSEIEVEMHDARQAWDDEAKAVEDKGVSDPLGGLAGSMMIAMMSNSSLRAVDTYAQQHCNLQVFGSAPR